MKRLYCSLLLGITVSFHVYGQDISSLSAVVLPVSPGTSYTVNSGSTVNITSAESVTLGDGTMLSSGSTVKVMVNQSGIIPPPSNPAADVDKNWVMTHDYDENGVEIGASKSFFDYSGKATQSQLKNETNGHIMASQPLYDLQGRPVGGTLPAPINNSAFAYKDNFISHNDTLYTYKNFDGNPSTTATQYSKLNNPDPVDNSKPGTLGWYYSNNNTLEPNVAATDYPYSRGDFFRDGSGAEKRNAGVDVLKMGGGHESSSVSFPVLNELNNYVAIRNKFFSADSLGAMPASTMAGKALQTISTDVNELNALSVTDLSGEQTLMTAKADVSGWLTVTNTANLENIYGQYRFDVNMNYLSQGGVISPGDNPSVVFKITSQRKTVTVYRNGVQTYQGSGDDFPFTYSPSEVEMYKVISDYPFLVTILNSHGTTYDNAPARLAEPSKSSIHYFQLTNPSAVTVTGNAEIYEMKGETKLSNFSSGNTLPAGYYKAIALAPTGIGADTLNQVAVTYSNKYSDISYNYYNQLGQLVTSIAPNGTKPLATNLAGTSSITYATTYKYDLQGRMIGSTSTDGGRSELAYRKDGKIRFSQNALQRNATPERYSYTNYDRFERPIESGEYVVSNGSILTFTNVKANTALLDSVEAAGDLTGGAKLSKVNTYYDLPNLSLTGYTQDAGFLKGAVSYITNANSTTWYNYDDHGRVTWLVKQIAGLSGYKTVNYTYNAQGNATKLDYQKGTSAERFIHYYAYDADGRLVNVQTSRDDVTKTQQANYYYYLHGPLKRTELGDHLQGIDYVYTAEGWLKSINTPTGVATNDPGKDGVSGAFAKDAFGMQLEYFAGDYNRTGSNITGIPTGTKAYYNGNVTGMSWQSNKPAIITDPGIRDPTMYTYTYDDKYQYNQAVWGAPNYSTGTFTPNASGIFQEKQISYDPNGNILGMQRTGSTGAIADDFSKYTYTPNTNQLTGVSNTAGTSTYHTYTYNNIGDLKTQAKGDTTWYLQYDVTGKISGIYTNAAMTTASLIESYIYDENGNRISVTNKNGATYYVYDASGNVLAIYTSTTGAPTPALQEIPVYGSDRLGTYYKLSGTYVYEIRDNTGSVRVAINGTKVSGQADVYTYNDYYPFGSIARRGGVGYRYAYQGAYAEQDETTGFSNFDLRMYDARIGRWISTDPAGQFASPYVGMGNNPVTGFDMKGDSINTTGSASATANFGKIMEAGMGSLATMTQAKNGNWTVSQLTSEESLKLTTGQAEMYNAVNKMISDPATSKFTLVDANDNLSHSVWVGDNGTSPISAVFGTHIIDIGDIKNLGFSSVINAQGALIHELFEGYQMQVQHHKPLVAHFRYAISMESAVEGVQSAGGATFNNNKTQLTIPVTVKGVQRQVIIPFTNGNVPPFGAINNKY